jgi:hypothetical protein
MVSPHFPPDTSAGAHRVRLLAPHLAALGWRPTVVTVEPGGYEGRLDAELAALVPADLEVVRAPALPVSGCAPCPASTAPAGGGWPPSASTPCSSPSIRPTRRCWAGR